MRKKRKPAAPTATGLIDGTNETWCAVDGALAQGNRGLPRGSSLLKLLAQYRDYRHRNYLPRLTAEQVLAWADAHYRATGKWPDKTPAGGRRPRRDVERHQPGPRARPVGLRGRSTLADLLERRRGAATTRSRRP